MGKSYICPFCERKVPKKEFLLGNGYCIWCNTELIRQIHESVININPIRAERIKKAVRKVRAKARSLVTREQAIQGAKKAKK